MASSFFSKPLRGSPWVADLVFEITALHRQMAVLKKENPPSRLQWPNRLFWVCPQHAFASRRWPPPDCTIATRQGKALAIALLNSLDALQGFRETATDFHEGEARGQGSLRGLCVSR
jgi:hypothetical protein